MTNCPNNTNINIQIKPISLTQTQFEQIKYNLSQYEWAIFLESADDTHIDSHYSIISAEPIATLQSFAGKNCFKMGARCERTKIDPFIILKEKREALFPLHDMQHNKESKLPFLGGILGTLNYELGYQFEEIKNDQQPNGLSLPELSVGFYDWALIFDHKKSLFFLVTHPTIKQLKTSKEQWKSRFNWLMSHVKPHKTAQPFQLTNNWSANMDKQQYSEKFNKIQQYILSGDCYQVNLAQRFKASYQGDEYQAYQALLAENRPPFAAFLRLPEQVILSLSPERFLKLTDRIVETKPIKGTRPRFDDLTLDKQSQKALQQSEKDRSENLMIVDLLRNDIGRVCQAGSVKVPTLFEIESFPAVHHLVSTVIGKLDTCYGVEDLLRVCFPGGSITGAPKIRSMEIIAELEPDRRQSYCGSIGYISANGEMDMNIAIRTLVCFEGEIYCWAGGGLVADSQVDAEYQECFDKVSRILPCLTKLNK
ncbi:aminodeoxychorismate synthase component I [Psychromonas hadalis]|uniref:aminodeoxychorismate synthase component I n=1 Tax=Psychromonas hadalis TaxID=211669 RepID=UPI0003B52ABB|nr:aminodeoxychorismate synthase component I [Psychromonas hadalis]